MEILIYGGIYDYTAELFFEKVNEAEGEDLTVRVNCFGGDVFASYGMIAKMQEYEGKIDMKVDGLAASMAAFMTLFAENVECLDVTNFMFHRADMRYASEDEKEWLKKVNAMLRQKMEAKIDKAKWKEVTGVSMSQLFDSEQRIDVTIDAKQAKKLGIVSKITKLEPKQAKAIKANYERNVSSEQIERFKLFEPIAAMAQVEESPIIEKSKTNKTMNIEQLKADHPEVYAAAVKDGVDQERDRAGAFLAFVDVDAKSVVEGIKSGEKLSQTSMAELSRKALQANVVNGVVAETTKTVETEPVLSETEKAEKDKQESLARIKAMASKKIV